jgi:hypothetical protein
MLFAQAALPVPELHPATTTDAAKTDTVEIVTPKSHRAEKLRGTHRRPAARIPTGMVTVRPSGTASGITARSVG